MKRTVFIFALACLLPSLYQAAEVRLLDLEPHDAQQIIEQQDQSLAYAPKVDTNVPAIRFLGNEPHHVLEDIYLAKQYHGQDGLGGYLYGYNVPDIAKTEKKKAGGDLRGAYNYIAGNGQEIKVQYWDDGNGFHQIDNVPKILPKQIDDLPAVKAAKEEHLRLWKEQAERNSRPVASPFNSEGQYASGPLSVQGQAQRAQQFAQQPQYQQPQYQQPQYQQTQYQQPQYQVSPTQVYQQNGLPDVYSGQYSENQNVYGQQKTLKQEEEDEKKYPPKGFFYSFDYPVGIIVSNQGRANLGGTPNGGLQQVYSQNKANFEEQLKAGSGKSQSYSYVQ